jgi:NADP-dependent 3-hydroxy acid dehydrogenase YdfG
MSRFNENTTGVEVVQALKDNIKGKTSRSSVHPVEHRWCLFHATVLITGPSDGTIGGQTALDLANASPKHIVLAGRDISKVQPVIDKIKADHPSVTVTFVKLDLADNASVKAAADNINGKIDQLDALINNAGGEKTRILSCLGDVADEVTA